MSAKRPNVLFIIADDLGFSDVGCYGSEISTPHIDALAAEGVRMLNYHTAAACSPTRAMLLTGTDAHLGGLGCLIEHRVTEQGAKRWRGKPGYEGYLNKDVAPLSEILSDNGYHTLLSGKWHLGLRPTHGPEARGFDKSFCMLPGCSNHYGWEPQLEGGETPVMLGGRPIHTENGRKADVKPNKTEDGFYSSDTYGDKLVQYLEERTDEEREKPFFAYYAFSAPHWPNQSPKAVREKYIDTYADGPAELRKRRLSKLVELGIISPDVVPHEVVNTGPVTEWDEMTAYEKQCSSRSMAAYAGMVEQLDHNVGKVISHLKSTGEYDNTLIVFMSDNGAEGAAYEAIPVLGPNLQKVFDDYYDNSLENIGNWNSFTWIGPLWAQASTAPSRLFKQYPTEGGILVPCVIKAPAFAPEHQGGVFSRAFTTCMDITPTILELTGIQLPPTPDGKKSLFRNREVHSVRGSSLLPYYRDGKHADVEGGERAAVHPSSEAIGWELHARAAMRQGKWKIVHIERWCGGAGVGDDGWQLYDVDADPGETVDLAETHPDKFALLLSLWEEYVTENQIVWGPGALEPGLTKEEAPHLHDVDFDQQRSWIQTRPGEVAVIV